MIPLKKILHFMQLREDYLDAGKISNFLFTNEKVNKTDSLQPSGCNRALVCKMSIS